MSLKSFLLSLVLVFILLIGCSGNQAENPVSETRLFLDTFCTITIYGQDASAIIAEAFDLCAEYEALFSITVEGSDVWRINHAGGEAVVLSPQTIEVIEAGLKFGELSGGMFDITIGRLSRLWDFSGGSAVPSVNDLDEARMTVDYRQVIVEGDTVRLTDPEAWIDLGGIAKGYIADRLADLLMERGAEGAVIDLGGDVRIVGERPDGRPWRIGVRRPFGEWEELLGVIEAGESAVVSSGIYERGFEDNGVLYHHILDPNTGLPVRNDVVSATVVADSAMTGDALSTIILLAGSMAAQEMLTSAPGFHGAVLVLDSGEVLEFGEIVFK